MAKNNYAANRDGYSLNCSWYERSFATLPELLEDIVLSGMDPNYEIAIDGKLTGDIAIDQIDF